jgi:hypothetical protein
MLSVLLIGMKTTFGFVGNSQIRTQYSQHA